MDLEYYQTEFFIDYIISNGEHLALAGRLSSCCKLPTLALEKGVNYFWMLGLET